MDKSHHNTRRELLKGAGAAFVSSAEGMPSFPPPSPLRALHRDWRAAMNEANKNGCDDAIYERICAMEQTAAEFEPKTAEDFAFMIIFADAHGDMCLTPHQVTLVRGAMRITGLASS